LQKALSGHGGQNAGIGADIMFANGKFGDVDTLCDHLAGLVKQTPAIVTIPVNAG